MITLFCLLNGEPLEHSFPIDISDDKTIGHLKKLIKEEKSALKEECAADLAVYSVSIPKGDRKALREASREIEQGRNQMLDPLDAVAKVFPNQAAGHIHIMVQRPKSSESHKRKFEDTTEGSESYVKKFEEVNTTLTNLVAKVEALHEDQRTTVSISRITKVKFDELLSEHGLQRSSIKFDLPSDGARDIPAFHWGDKNESAHSPDYLHWLNVHIPLPDGVQYYCSSNESDFLTTTFASARFTLSGTTDVAVVDETYVESMNAPRGMRVGIELKKHVTPRDVMQAATELVSAAAIAKFPVAILLTDLNDYWQFFWLTKKEIVDCKFGRHKASIFLKILASDPTVSASGSGATPNTPHQERCTLAGVHGIKSSDNEVDGLQSVLTRPKVDFMDLLPRGDVADMRDVFDTMSSEEIMEWARKASLRYLMKTPAFQSSITRREDWKSMYA